MKQSYSLFELNEYIKRVMALNFAEPIWINAEIAQIKESRGNIYIELVEQNESGEVLAQISAAIWYKSFLFIKNKLGALTGSLLAPGVQVLVKVSVDFHERYGLKLLIDDIDPAYTMGQLEMARQKIIDRLMAEGVFEQNKSVTVPKVLQRLAVISSETAAGYQDFCKQLEENRYGYDFDITLYPAALQGQNTEREVCAALDNISDRVGDFDAIAIIRGGGSKLDLAYFDNFNIGYKIATFPIPVITGIGHEIDQSIADMVSGIPLKTPTAVAAYLIEKAVHFESEIIEMQEYIYQLSKQMIKGEQLALAQITTTLTLVPSNRISAANQQLNYTYKTIKGELAQKINYSHRDLKAIQQWITSNDPRSVMKKGYTLIKQNDQYITSAKKLKKEAFEVLFADGTVSGKGI